jgi:hypothetical protein
MASNLESGVNLEIVVSADLAKVPTPLTPKNVVDWKYQVEIALTTGHVFDKFIEKDENGNRQEPPEDDAELRRWNELKITTCNWIKKVASREHVSTMAPFLKDKDPAGLWDALIGLYQQESAPTRFKAWKDIITFQRQANEDYVSVFSRVDNLIRELELMSPSNRTEKQVRDEIALFTVLSTIDRKHSFMATTIKDRSLTYSTLKREIQHFESLCSDGDNSLQNAPVVSQSLMLEQASLACEPSCDFCERTGHSTYQCHMMKKYKQMYLAQRHQPSLNFNPDSIASNPYRGSRNRRGRRGRGRGGNGGNADHNSQMANTTDTDAIMTIESEPSHESAGQASSSRSSNLPISDQWIADSGASCNMTPRSDWVFEKQGLEWNVKLADGSIILSSH